MTENIKVVEVYVLVSVQKQYKRYTEIKIS